MEQTDFFSRQILKQLFGGKWRQRKAWAAVALCTVVASSILYALRTEAPLSLTVVVKMQCCATEI